MPVATYTKAGTKASTPAKLDKAVFGLEVKNHQLIKDAYLAYLANGRVNNAVTKKRGEVRGGGRKHDALPILLVISRIRRRFMHAI
jgi:ribosomal protein L4